MAEILLYVTDEVRPDTAYQDGDIVCAFTDRRIQACHAQSIAHWRTAPLNGDGLRVDGTAKRVMEAVCGLKFERVSATEVRRTNLATLEQVLIGPTPNAAGEFINVQEYLRRRKAHPQHRIFGTAGAEVWYMRDRWQDESKVAAAWDVIEADTLHRRTHPQRTRWPLTDTEKRHFLALPTDAMRETVAARATAWEIDYDDQQPEYNLDAGVGDKPVRKRRAFVAWRDLGLPVADILDPAKVVDLRDVLPPAGPQVAQAKPRINYWSARDHLQPDPTLFIGGPPV